MLDPLTRRVTQGERVVDLSPREFALLEFLLRHAGRSVSRSRIAEAGWNYQFDPETNVVDVYVHHGGLGIELVVPHRFGHARAGHGEAGVAQQQLAPDEHPRAQHISEAP